MASYKANEVLDCRGQRYLGGKFGASEKSVYSLVGPQRCRKEKVDGNERGRLFHDLGDARSKADNSDRKEMLHYVKDDHRGRVD